MCGDGLWFEEPGDELDDDEYPDEDQDEDEEVTATVACPECGAEVYEDAPRCPACGNYIIHDTGVWSGRPGWWVLLGLLGVLALIAVLTGLVWW